MRWNLLILVLILKANIAFGEDSGWRFFSYSNACSILLTDNIVLNPEELITYSLSFNVASSSIKNRDYFEKDGLKPYEIVGNISIVLSQYDDSLFGGKELGLPIALYLDNQKLVGSKADDWEFGMKYLIKSPLSEVLLERITNEKSSGLTLEVEGRGKALPVGVSQKKLALNKALLFECKRFFKG